MAQLTQLGLSGQANKKSEISNADSHNHLTRTRQTAAFAGSLIATALLGAVLLQTSACSKESKPTVSAKVDPAGSYHPATPLPTALDSSKSAAVQPPAVKKIKHHKIPVSTYTNLAYNVSFRFPKYDSLKQGDEANIEWPGMGPVEMNFVEDGGVTLGAIELPHDLYPGTDFAAAFVNVSVNRNLSAEQCEQFAFPIASGADDAVVTPAKLKIGSTEFSEMDAVAASDTRKANARYYHVFQNGSCYEFLLGLETANEGNDKQIKPIDHERVFHRLEWILSTVKLEPLTVPQKPAAVVASDTSSVPSTTATPVSTTSNTPSTVSTAASSAEGGKD